MISRVDEASWQYFTSTVEAVLQAMKTNQVDAFFELQKALCQRSVFAEVFSDNASRLEKKIVKTLAFLKNQKRFKDLQQALQSVNRTHSLYGQFDQQDYQCFENALLVYVKAMAGIKHTHFDSIWKQVFSTVATALYGLQNQKEITLSKAFIDAVGGQSVLDKVHERLYQTLFNDPWLGQFFYGKSQTSLAKKQGEFMLEQAGLTPPGSLESPYTMHMHMYITDEMYDLRQTFLRQAMMEENISQELQQQWIDYDNKFRSAITKTAPNECVTRCIGQMPIVPKCPISNKA